MDDDQRQAKVVFILMKTQYDQRSLHYISYRFVRLSAFYFVFVFLSFLVFGFLFVGFR